MKKTEFKLLYAILKNGPLPQRELAEAAGVSLGTVSSFLGDFRNQKLVDDKGLTPKGLKSLKPYKVKNAIIMAAGMSSRFVPLSYEKPKGLLVVKGEVLIERQIEQLKEAGIDEIVIVVGYKKESFFYLEDKYGVKIIINPEYNIKNNIETLYVAREYIGNSYICSSDDYFEENVFEDYVYQSYYASLHVEEKTDEWYMTPDSKFNVKKVTKSGEEGYIMLGHVYFNLDFAKEFKKLMDKHRRIGDYDDNLWEDLFADNIKTLPPMEIKVYPKDTIFEFDSLDELRAFDSQYVKNTQSKIMKNIARVLKCKEEDIKNISSLKSGITNTTFLFDVKGKKYVYRHPGEGSEEIVSRKHERRALELAKKTGIDPTFIFMDEKEGWKISSYLEKARIPDYERAEDSRRISTALKKLHGKGIQVDWTFNPWEEAQKLEKLLEKKGSGREDFAELRDAVKKCYERTQGDGVKPVFCHCDTYAPNWMLTDKKTVLIDWEYAGNADPGCDIGSYIMDSMWEVEEGIRFIKEYCGKDFDEKMEFHYLAYTAAVSYYWFCWARYREACGAVMGASMHNWYVMAKRYSKYLIDKYGL